MRRYADLNQPIVEKIDLTQDVPVKVKQKTVQWSAKNEQIRKLKKENELKLEVVKKQCEIQSKIAVKKQ